jgi:hypothetical protein
MKKKSKAGRKPIEDKKVQVYIFPRQSEIEAVGGIEAVKEVAYQAVKKTAIKKMDKIFGK